MSNKLLGISLPQQSKKDILDKIIKYTLSQNSFVHIVSLNPENIVIAQHDKLKKDLGIDYMVGYNSGLQCLQKKVFSLAFISGIKSSSITHGCFKVTWYS